MIKTTYILPLLILLSACERTIPNLEIPAKPAKLVVNGLAIADSSILVSISKSLSYKDELEFKAVENAVVSCESVSGASLSFNYRGNGWYLSNEQTQFSGICHIEVSAEGMETVTGTFEIPHKPEVLRTEAEVVSANYTYCLNCEPYYQLRVSVTLRDVPNEANYYMIEMVNQLPRINSDIDENGNEQQVYLDSITTTPWIRPDHRMSLNSSSLIIEAIAGDWYSNRSAGESAYGKQLLFSDSYFPGQEYTLQLDVDVQDFAYILSDSSRPPSAEKLLLKVYSIDPNYFNYVKNQAQVSATEDNPLAEPVTPYSSFDNGFGLIYGASMVIDTIDLLEIAPQLAEPMDMIR